MNVPSDSPFVGTSLKPQAHAGTTDGGRLYVLGSDSSHPVARGFDEEGQPIEETWPIAYHRRFVHPTGTINRVPLRTGAVYSQDPRAVGYEVIQVYDLIGSGWLPLEACPHTLAFAHITGGRALVPIPPGADHEEIGKCQGDMSALNPGKQTKGCVHMQAEIKRRQVAAAAKYEHERATSASMKAEDVKALFEGLTSSFADALHRSPETNLAGRRGAMREQEKGRVP